MKEALLYKRLSHGTIECFLCAHHCKIKENSFGICKVRQNIEGKLFTHVYGHPCAMHVDPIEKKPLYHFFPGSSAFSLATLGCNFRCGFCQNWQISQIAKKEEIHILAEEKEVLPSEVLRLAMRYNCKSISYTYTEPTIFFEYALDICRLARENGIYNNFVTNGFMTKEALEIVAPYLDAANVDLKFFRDESYKENCGGRLKPVLDTISLMYKLGIWIEITTLIIPDKNDSESELKDIANFIASLDNNIPWHVSRFHPDFKFMEYNHTPEKTLKEAQEIGFNMGLRYVYVGNILGWGNDTYCHNCKKLLIKREIFNILENNIKEGKCSYCNTIIPGFF